MPNCVRCSWPYPASQGIGLFGEYCSRVCQALAADERRAGATTETEVEKSSSATEEPFVPPQQLSLDLVDPDVERCHHCGQPIEDDGYTAPFGSERFCSLLCVGQWSDQPPIVKEQPRRSDVRPRRDIWNRAVAPAATAKPRTCKWCGKPIPQPETGRPREFCPGSSSCRQKWYRHTRKAKTTGQAVF